MVYILEVGWITINNQIIEIKISKTGNEVSMDSNALVDCEWPHKHKPDPNVQIIEINRIRTEVYDSVPVVIIPVG